MLEPKIVNTVIYLSSKIQNLYKTKLLKLVYLLDEISVKETGSKFTNLDYHVWQYGPVNIDLYNISFNNHSEIQVIANKYGEIIRTTTTFCDDEFSDYDIELMDRIIKIYSNYTSKELVDLLHQEESLWMQKVKEKELEAFFKYDENTRTKFKIDFEKLVEDCFYKKAVYQSAEESLRFQKTI